MRPLVQLAAQGVSRLCLAHAVHAASGPESDPMERTHDALTAL